MTLSDVYVKNAARALPADVIDRDRALSESATLLMELRWRWTLDLSNPDRVSSAEYGRQVGIARQVVESFARGYELITAGRAASPQEAIERAHMGAETQAATEAVAEIHKVSFGTASKVYRDDVRTVREEARERAEALDTDYWAQLPEASDSLRMRVNHRRSTDEDRRARRTQTFIKADSRLVQAGEKITSATNEIRGVDFGKEDIEDLTGRIAWLRSRLDEFEEVLQPTRKGIALVS